MQHIWLHECGQGEKKGKRECCSLRQEEPQTFLRWVGLVLPVGLIWLLSSPALVASGYSDLTTESFL